MWEGGAAMTDRPDAEQVGTTGSPAARFLRFAKLCRIRDVEQLLSVSELVRDMGELIHALQKERGASSIYLGSNGLRFVGDLAGRTEDSRRLELVLRARLEGVDERMSSGAQFYTRVALALHALDGMTALREQVASVSLVPQDSVKAFTDVIGHLLNVVFEAADTAADPAISRALVALFNFVQGKEYAGQERATAGAGFTRGHFDTAEHRRLVDLAVAQNRAFQIFREFATPAQVMAFDTAMAGPVGGEVERMRAVALSGGRNGDFDGITGEAWYEHTTRRIDAMKAVEDRLGDDLRTLCAATLAQARADLDSLDGDGCDGTPDAVVPVAMMLLNPDPAQTAHGIDADGGVYALDGLRPKLMRSLLNVVQAQSRRLRDVSLELESARTALSERKVIDRAKGLLMTSRGVSEEDAYRLMRKTAMNQNKRIVDVAEAILSMSDILRSPPRANGGANTAG